MLTPRRGTGYRTVCVHRRRREHASRMTPRATPDDCAIARNYRPWRLEAATTETHAVPLRGPVHAGSVHYGAVRLMRTPGRLSSTRSGSG